MPQKKFFQNGPDRRDEFPAFESTNPAKPISLCHME
jgi:hypothetical protein